VSVEPYAKRVLTDQGGSSAVEFAIVSPMLILLLVGIVTFGWAMNAVHTVRLALEQAGRALQLNPSLTQAQLATLVQDDLGLIGDPSVTITLAADTSVAGVTAKRISAVYVFAVPIPFLSTYNITYQTRLTVPIVAS
jgi:Flp pilus assembly protein TadG